MAKPPIRHGSGDAADVEDTSRFNQGLSKTKSKKNKSKNASLALLQSDQSQTRVTTTVYGSDEDGNKRRGPPDEHRSGDSILGYVSFDHSNKVRISLNSSSTTEIREIKRKLISELDKVRSLKKRIEAKEISFDARNGDNDNFVGSDGNDRVGTLARANSAISCVGPVITRPSDQYSCSTVANATKHVDKKKMAVEGMSTNSESNKKLKSGGMGKRDEEKNLESNKSLKSGGEGKRDDEKSLKSIKKSKSSSAGKRDGEMDLESNKRSKSSNLGKKDGQKNSESNKKLKSDSVRKRDEEKNLESNKKPKSDSVRKGDGEMDSESNKKLKPSSAGKRDGDKEVSGRVGFSKELHRRCQDLLGKLMKHQYGWVFNEPVDAKKLKLRDYYTIIKHPMDLGTVNSRLSMNWYKSPSEFADDIRLTFNNAMTYNEKGQDVHAMADVLLKMFEDKWAAVKAKFNIDDEHEGRKGTSVMKPKKKKVLGSTSAQPRVSDVALAMAPSFDQTPADARTCISAPIQSQMPMETESIDRSDSTAAPVAANTNAANVDTNKSESLIPDKPNEKDDKRRDMSYEEKQRLSNDLQNLPSEKLESIVDIIRKRNPELFNQDDEIEVDIENFDAETLWELDEFVTEYKKSLNEEYASNKREAGDTSTTQKQTSPHTQRSKEPGAEIQGGDASGSSRSDSSSSDSGSSQSDSDIDSAS